MIAVIFTYTTIANIIERPDGVKIAACFIAGILVISLLYRAFELRVTQIDTDETATTFLRECGRRKIRLIANEPDRRDAREYSDKIAQILADNDMADDNDIIFIEVTVADASDFEAALQVRGEVLHHRYRILTMESSSVPSAIAALLLHIRDTTHRRPHIYFEWTEGTMGALSGAIYGRTAALHGLPGDDKALVADSADQFTRVRRLADGEREYLQGVIEFYQSILTILTILTIKATIVAQTQNEKVQRLTEASYAQNEQVKKISSWAAIVFAPSLVAAVYGMNFDHMPELHWRVGYPFALALMIAAAVALHHAFRRRGWL